MYSAARKLSVLCIVLVAVNIAGAILTALYLKGENVGFTNYVSLMMYLIPSTALTLFLSIAVRSMVQDMEIEVSNHNHSIKKLTDRIKELENKLK